MNCFEERDVWNETNQLYKMELVRGDVFFDSFCLNSKISIDRFKTYLSVRVRFRHRCAVSFCSSLTPLPFVQTPPPCRTCICCGCKACCHATLLCNDRERGLMARSCIWYAVALRALVRRQTRELHKKGHEAAMRHARLAGAVSRARRAILSSMALRARLENAAVRQRCCGMRRSKRSRACFAKKNRPHCTVTDDTDDCAKRITPSTKRFSAKC